MGSPNYAIGSPLFTKATVNLDNGKKIVINAPANNRRNVYVQGLRVNGQAYNKTFLPHDILAAGATLDFTMGPRPSTWGTGAGSAPPSITQDDAVARPLRDATKPGSGTPAGSDGTAVAGLFDNTSATWVDFAGTRPWFQHAFPAGAPRDRVTHYTLTSGPTLGQPRSVIGPEARASATAQNPPGETAANLIDADAGTKWLAFQPTAAITVDLGRPVAATGYWLTSANDAAERDPRDWILSGSADGQTWTPLDARTGQAFGERFQTKNYPVGVPAAYRYYRLSITAGAGAGLLQLAELGLTDGGTAGDPTSWRLLGSHDGQTWTTLDERTGEAFPWRRQTRAFAVSRPGRFGQYRLEVTANTGDATTTLAEVELLAAPDPGCTSTVSGRHAGPLTVAAGTTCLAPGATVAGPVTVRPGAALYAFDAAIDGPLSATGAAAVVLVHTTVAGPMTAAGTTGELSLQDSTIGGPVSLVGNAGGPDRPALVAGNRIRGPLSCVLNVPPPVNAGLPNTVDGPRTAQCQAL
jgi:hypothetical protein